MPIEFRLFSEGSNPDEDGVIDVWLYTDSFEQPLNRSQSQEVNNPGIQAGATAEASGTDGLQAGDLDIRGRWFGADAPTLHDRLKNGILDDPSVERVELQAYDSTDWSTTNHQLNGAYYLGADCRSSEVAQSNQTSYKYRLVLIED